MDECQGTTANDSSGNGNTGTINIGATGTQTSAGTCTTSGTAWDNGATGKYNESLNFDGTDDYVSIPTSTALHPGNTFSLSAWVKRTTTGTADAIISGGASDFQLWFFSDNKLYLSKQGVGNIFQSTSTFTDSNWHHIVATKNGSTTNIYVDGVAIAGTVTDQAITATTNTLYIGGDGNSSNVFAGQIDDVHIYNYPLTLAQVKQIYNQGAGVRYPVHKDGILNL